jgi:hypothetical protein
MNHKQIKKEKEKEKLIRFIQLNNPFYAFAYLEEYSMKQLKKLKKDTMQPPPPAPPKGE